LADIGNNKKNKVKKEWEYSYHAHILFCRKKNFKSLRVERMSTLSIAVLLPSSYLASGGEATANLALADTGSQSSTLYVYPCDTVDQQTTAIEQFLQTSPGPKAFIVGGTNFLIAADQQVSDEVPIISISASATSLSTKVGPNAISYLASNQSVVQSVMLPFRAYAMQSILFLYTEETLQSYGDSTTDLIQQFTLQCALLGIPLSVHVLGASPPAVAPGTLVYIYSIVPPLVEYTTPQWIRSFPSDVFIIVGDVGIECPDIFGTVPAMVQFPWPSDFTTTSQRVFTRIPDNSNNNPFIYPLYDVVYSYVSLYQTLQQQFTISQYLDYNAFTTLPPAYSPVDLINPSTQQPYFGAYFMTLTRNVGITEIQATQYVENFGGAFPFCVQGVVWAFNSGRVPFFNSSIFFNRNILYQYDNGKIRFSKDITTSPSFSQPEDGNFTFTYAYNDDDYFTSLVYYTNPVQKMTVNPTMSIPRQCLCPPKQNQGS